MSSDRNEVIHGRDYDPRYGPLEKSVPTMTEFGRTVRENGSKGSDHGRGSSMFVLGGNIVGGKVYGTVPELRPENLEDQRDIPVTTDFRTVFAEVLRGHLGIQQWQKVFPDNPQLATIKLFNS